MVVLLVPGEMLGSEVIREGQLRRVGSLRSSALLQRAFAGKQSAIGKTTGELAADSRLQDATGCVLLDFAMFLIPTGSKCRRSIRPRLLITASCPLQAQRPPPRMRSAIDLVQASRSRPTTRVCFVCARA